MRAGVHAPSTRSMTPSEIARDLIVVALPDSLDSRLHRAYNALGVHDAVAVVEELGADLDGHHVLRGVAGAAGYPRWPWRSARDGERVGVVVEVAHGPAPLARAGRVAERTGAGTVAGLVGSV